MSYAVFFEFQFLIGSLGTLIYRPQKKRHVPVSIPYRQSRYGYYISRCSFYRCFNSLQVVQVLGRMENMPQVWLVSIPYRQSRYSFGDVHETADAEFQFLIGSLGTNNTLLYKLYKRCFNSLQVVQVPCTGSGKNSLSKVSIPYRQSRYHSARPSRTCTSWFQFLIGSLGTSIRSA